MSKLYRFLSVLGIILIQTSIHSQSNTPCTGAIPTAPNITINTSCTFQAGTTVGSTQQTNAANGGTPSCGAMGPDVWYSFTAPPSGTVTITTSAGSFADGVMALYSGTCGAFTQLACNDDAIGLMPQINQSGLTPGTTYFIRFWRYGGGTGTFNICVQSASAPPPVTNTVCTNQTPICSGSPITFTANAGGTPASTANPGNNYGCLFTSPNPSWYYLEIATGGNLIVDITAGSDVDFAIWGPFPNVAAGNAACNSYGPPADCSYSTAAVEQVNLSGVTTGQVYVLLVTNFASVVQSISVNNAGGSATTNCGILLPVGYSNWEGEFVHDKVKLKWTTESESNSDYFAVQRSADGNIWETISIVNAHGNTSVPKNYTEMDKNPINGTNYYRLMQVDNDGSFSYNNVIPVEANQIRELTVYPNPATNTFFVGDGENAFEHAYITDLVGKRFELPAASSDGGITVDCSNVENGLYTLTVRDKTGEEQSQQLVIRK